MIEMTSAATKPGAGLPVCVIPRAFNQRRPNKGGENQIPPMIQALSPASTIAIQLKLDVSKDTMASPPPWQRSIPDIRYGQDHEDGFARTTHL
jgi:hypothetical protein